MAYNFPANPTVGDNYTSPDGKLTYAWNGFGWDMKAKTAAAQRPVTLLLAPWLMERGAPDVEMRVFGDLFTSNTKVIIIPNAGVGTEEILPTTWISLNEVTATFPTSAATSQTTYNVYTETDGLRSLTMKQAVTMLAPVHNSIDPTTALSVASGGANFNLSVYFTSDTATACNSGSADHRVFVDGNPYPLTSGLPGGVLVNNVIPAAAPGTQGVRVQVQANGENTQINVILSPDPDMILTYT